jgi:O-antigen biosynthesis protein WbqP
MYRFFIKRLLDIICSTLAIVVLCPVYFVIAILIKIDSAGPILFQQKRIGINKCYFNMLKFRTMRLDTPSDIPTHLLDDPDQWITKFGKFLRKTSLDELPQFWNILRGEMSVIGPRPALWNQDDLIMERDKYGANNVRPGLTGWAQVNGRDELEIPVKAKFDGKYVRNLSLVMDIKCLLLSIIKVINQDSLVEGRRKTDSTK